MALDVEVIGDGGVGRQEALRRSRRFETELLPLSASGRLMRDFCVEPGMIKTDFGGRSFDFAMDETLSDYAPTAEALGRLFGKLAANPSAPEAVAEVIWQAGARLVVVT